MARVYAGILALLAFAAVVAAGVLHGAAPNETVWRAVLALSGFAMIGYIVGRIAEWITDESVRGRLTDQLQNKTPTPPTT